LEKTRQQRRLQRTSHHHHRALGALQSSPFTSRRLPTILFSSSPELTTRFSLELESDSIRESCPQPLAKTTVSAPAMVTHNYRMCTGTVLLCTRFRYFCLEPDQGRGSRGRNSDWSHGVGVAVLLAGTNLFVTDNDVRSTIDSVPIRGQLVIASHRIFFPCSLSLRSWVELNVRGTVPANVEPTLHLPRTAFKKAFSSSRRAHVHVCFCSQTL
jgi:hypothetical protein